MPSHRYKADGSCPLSPRTRRPKAKLHVPPPGEAGIENKEVAAGGLCVMLNLNGISRSA